MNFSKGAGGILGYRSVQKKILLMSQFQAGLSHPQWRFIMLDSTVQTVAEVVYIVHGDEME
jgi:hypothetical protein